MYSNTIVARTRMCSSSSLALSRVHAFVHRFPHTHTRGCTRETCAISACTYILIRTSGTVRNTFETRREVRSRLRASPASAAADPQDPATANNWKRRQSSRYSWQRNRSSQYEERAISSLVVDTAGNKQPRTRVYARTPSHTARVNRAPCHRSSTIDRFNFPLQLAPTLEELLRVRRFTRDLLRDRDTLSVSL